MHRTSIGVILIFLALSSSVAKAAEQNVILGVLEDIPGVYAGEPNFYRVRVVFQKNGENWQAFPSKCSNQSCLMIVSGQYPSKVARTIAFDGRKLGQVTAQTPIPSQPTLTLPKWQKGPAKNNLSCVDRLRR